MQFWRTSTIADAQVVSCVAIAQPVTHVLQHYSLPGHEASTASTTVTGSDDTLAHEIGTSVALESDLRENPHIRQVASGGTMLPR